MCDDLSLPSDPSRTGPTLGTRQPVRVFVVEDEVSARRNGPAVPSVIS